MSKDLKQPKTKEIVIPVYFTYDENDKILIDEEGMKDEFEIALNQIVVNERERELK